MLKHLVLPLGISFFTFQQMSFIIDSYKKETPPYNLKTYALFVVFFPQLIAGPIVTHTEIIPQFMDLAKRKLCWKNLSCGIYIFAIGLFKKVIMADTFGNAVTWGFSNYRELNATNAFLTMLCYTIQIYFDFSGYCDMAIGIGKMFNIDLPLNFNSPYKALTITEFWDRWHITLTRFFTKYVYIPLGGNRKGTLRMYVNTMIVFIASGVWHGANWTFILWGFIHGVFIIITKKWNLFFQKLHPVLNWSITFSFINVTWILFRSDSISQAVAILKPMLKLDIGPIAPAIIEIFQLEEIELFLRIIFGQSLLQHYPFICMASFLMISLIIILGKNNSYEHMLIFKSNVTNGALTVIFLVWSILSFSGVSTFLYFNF